MEDCGAGNGHFDIEAAGIDFDTSHDLNMFTEAEKMNEIEGIPNLASPAGIRVM